MTLHEKGEIRDGWGSSAHAIVISVKSTRVDAYNSTRLNAYKKIRRASKNNVSTSRSQCT